MRTLRCSSSFVCGSNLEMKLSARRGSPASSAMSAASRRRPSSAMCAACSSAARGSVRTGGPFPIKSRRNACTAGILLEVTRGIGSDAFTLLPLEIVARLRDMKKEDMFGGTRGAKPADAEPRLDYKEIQREVEQCEKDIVELRSAYELYFMGVEKVEPVIQRDLINAQLRRWKELPIKNT